MLKLSLITVIGFCAIACGKDLSTSALTITSAAAATPNTPAKAAEKSVDLAPLPLKLTMASEEMAMAMDMSMGESKSVSVSYEAVNAGINVSESTYKTFDEVKKEYKGDTILFPFKRWVKEGPTTAVEEFSSDGKVGYLSLSWKQIGGKNYVCKSNGLSGLKSAEDGDKVIKTCDTLAAK